MNVYKYINVPENIEPWKKGVKYYTKINTNI